jgi:NADH-quinone oxidoreductase subunit E
MMREEMLVTEPTAPVGRAIERYGGAVGFLIPILQDVQRDHGYLPLPQLKELSRQLEIPLSQIYSVATFYKSLSLRPRGRHVISVCTGTVCHLKGAGKLVKALRDHLRLAAGDTTEDMRYSLETVNCVGACALAPVVVVDGNYHAKAKPGELPEVLESCG